MRYKHILTILFLFHICTNIMFGQKIKEKRDTLQSITVTADTLVVRPSGLQKVDIPKMQHMVSALGEGDVIKYIQTLPGISIGVEGTSSFYVRGGNLGNNVITLDGVRLYGYGHLLGLTSSFSNDIVGSAHFNVGGFDAESYNLLASHINITTKEPNFDSYDSKAGISNFMISGYHSGPIKEGVLAYEVSARVSPLSLEYNLGKKFLEKRLDMFKNLSANVYDVYGKVSYKPNNKHTINGSFFYSSDDFGYGDVDVSSYDNMSWSNMIGTLSWICDISDKWRVNTHLSYNHYKSGQTLERVLSGVYNKLSVHSSIEEYSVNTNFTHDFTQKLSLQIGVRGTFSTFKPGSYHGHLPGGSFLSDNTLKNILGNLYTELTYDNKEKFRFKLALRGNYYIGERNKVDEYSGFDPEISFSGSVKLARWIGIEATYDRLIQYYHTLEGIPLGWSLDLIVPSSIKLHPEKGTQYYGGLFFMLGKQHRLSVGAYYKEMKNLIYFEKASEFFSQSLTGWKEFIKIGEGKSEGVEFLYQKDGKRLSYKLAYTLSKTTRYFPELNNGKEFRAKFDRPHILNATMDYLFACTPKNEYGANLMVSYQSGNLESVKSGNYPGIIPGYEVIYDYYSGYNNMRLEDYIRFDIGAYAKWKRPKVSHNLQVGIYNLTNRHNIFGLYYDIDDSTWKKVYVFPIMPSVSYSIKF